MKQLFILLLNFTIISAYSQIGKSYIEVHRAFPQEEKGILRIEGDNLIEDIQLKPEEAMMVIYSKDSIVVGFGYLNDDGITEEKYNEIINREIPKFTLSKKTKFNGATYSVDSINNFLTITNPQNPKSNFPLSNFLIIVSPKIIEQWTKNVKTWE